MLSCFKKILKNLKKTLLDKKGFSDSDGQALKCPLHENFNDAIAAKNGTPWTLDDVWSLEKKYKRKIGLIVDSTKTNRYYDWSRVVEKKCKYKKVPLEIPNDLIQMPFPIIEKLVDYIDDYRTKHPDKIVAIHWFVLVLH